MVDVVRQLQDSIRKFEAHLTRVKARQVGAGPVRDEARALVDNYFRRQRELIRGTGIPADLVLKCDSKMQDILAATHHHTTLKIYRHLVRCLGQDVQELEKAALLQSGQARIAGSNDPLDRKIIETLKTITPSGALSYEQGILDLQGDERLSWRGPATDLREALRECLDHLAPDNEVESQPAYKRDPNVDRPTMKQKVRFILRTRGIPKSAFDAPEAAVQAVEDSVGAYVRSVYTRSSLSTHTPTDKREVLRVRDFVRVALCELLEIRLA